MGLIDRIATRVATEINKAPNLPAGATTLTETQMRNAANNNTYGVSDALPRNPILPMIPFGPGQPLVPGAINPLTDSGRPDPRRNEFQVAQNINVTETRPISFATLRGAAEQIDILRRCIEVLKNKIIGLQWDIVLGEDSVEKIITEIGGTQVRAAQLARDKYTDEINKAKQFWEQPDRSNGFVFADWLNIALEEILVLDAWTVWPQKTVGGDLLGLQILDGATIKPLIDDRGMRPMPPFPAFQQILYGFPRSEFTAPTESEKTDGEFTTDELAYMVKNRRTTTIYGYSPTERALSVADIYLRRQQWLRAEYTDGVTPELLMKTDATFGNNPDLLRAYENIFNNDLAGQTEQRKRVRLLPSGMEPIQFDGYGERFKDTLDDYLVNSICGHYGVMPSEIGFNPKGGLGGSGFQLGQAESSEVIGAIPLANWIARMITNLSYVFLGMPRELEFKFMESGRTDSEADARTNDINIKSGNLTINESRSRNGLSLIDAKEADLPIIVAGSGAYFVTPNGILPFDNALANTSTAVEEIENTSVNELGEKYDDTETVKVQKEMKAFLRFVRKSPTRAFDFKDVPVIYADVLNKFVSVADYDSARWYAERYLA